MTTRHIAGAAGPPPATYDADVVILSLDRAEETVAAIASALAQTGVSRHVFIVDQGRGRRTWRGSPPSVAGRTGRDAGGAGPQSRRRRRPQPRIGARAWPRHLRRWTTTPSSPTHDTLARAVAALDADPTLAAIGCRIVLHATDADDLSSWGYPRSLLPRAGEIIRRGHLRRRRPRDPPRRMGCGGGYDEALFFCWEEFDFCLRAIERGWRIRYRGDIVVRHKVSPEQRVAWSGTRWFYFVRNRLYIERKWGAGWLGLLPRLAFYLLKGARNGVLLADSACGA